MLVLAFYSFTFVGLGVLFLYCLLVWVVDSITVCWFWRLIPLLFVVMFDSCTVCWFGRLILLLFVGFGVLLLFLCWFGGFIPLLFVGLGG